jgi:FKBP-type peptidyl-prolyl cis-trans isomerase FkpA
MRKILPVLAAAVLVLAACSKSKDTCAFTASTAVATAAEISGIQGYLAANSLTAQQHPSGVFYNITTPGSGGATAELCSNITVKYTGRLTNGVQFDANAVGVQFQLGQLIVGWQKGLPLIQAGGKIRLYVPPSLGYGSQDVRDNLGVVVIPANSTLVFDIELLNVQ